MTRGLNTSSVLELPAEIHQPGKCFLLHRIHKCNFRDHCSNGYKIYWFVSVHEERNTGAGPQLERLACGCLVPAGASARILIVLNGFQWPILFFFL